MANFEAFHWNFSLSVNLFFLKSELPIPAAGATVLAATYKLLGACGKVGMFGYFTKLHLQ